MVSGFNAKRFVGKPLRQPTYTFKDVPKCARNLEGSSLQEVTERDHFNDTMAEMVLLCNETMRRQHIVQNKRASKPLSLEYIADRLDVDDPMFGYFVRTDGSSNATKGMLQGFITVTTFTNWQKTFRWDSMHDSAVAYDHGPLAAQMASGERKFDQDGTLAEALQSTVRCGDPWNEGIVWPRIAEISLLGAMGCGKALVSLVIEKLECMKPNGKRNYDYVALQATDNSIPFYESLGFVRVGCITEDLKFDEKQGKSGDEPPLEASSPTSQPSEIVSSAVEFYSTENPGETPTDVAKRLDVDVWDIIFLNQFVYPDIGPRSRLMKDTKLFVPSPEAAKADATSHAARSFGENLETSAPQWYIAKENDTPKMIARQFQVSCADLVAGNRERLPELQSISRLREGTRIKVSHFHIHDDKHVPYCHWTFPDDTLETSEPSYMMVRKLNRRKGTLAKAKPVESSFAVPITPYTAPPAELFVVPPASAVPSELTPRPATKKRARHVGEPVKPKKPVNGYMVFSKEQREKLNDEFAGQPAAQVVKKLSKMWQELPEVKKDKYRAKHEKEQVQYLKAMEKYKKDLDKFHKAHPELKPIDDGDDAKISSNSLFNKVVKLTPEGKAQSRTEFDYFFVLTYIPDLKWCHLAPMVQIGTWGPDKPKCEGRPIWMLVDEGEGQEVDISAVFCEPVRSRAMKRCVDADNERWDIIDDGSCVTASVTTRLSTQETASPKRRGRPPKDPQPEIDEPAKRRGRPPKKAQAKDAPAKRRGRPPKKRPQPEAASPPAVSVGPKRKRANSAGGVQASLSVVSAPSGSINSDVHDDDWTETDLEDDDYRTETEEDNCETETDKEDADWKPGSKAKIKLQQNVAAPKRRGRPPKKSRPEQVTPKRRGRPPKKPQPKQVTPKRRGRPPKQSAAEQGTPKRRGRPPKQTSARTEPLDGSVDAVGTVTSRNAPARRCRQQPDQPRAATKPLSGAIKRKRKRKNSVTGVAKTNRDSNEHTKAPETGERPTKRRKLPPRHVRATPTKKPQNPVKDVVPSIEIRTGTPSSASRTVAPTRSAEKVPMGIPRMLRELIN